MSTITERYDFIFFMHGVSQGNFSNLLTCKAIGITTIKYWTYPQSWYITDKENVAVNLKYIW